MGSEEGFYGFGLLEMKFLRIMGDDISEHSITFCWEDACQQHTVENIMGSRG